MTTEKRIAIFQALKQGLTEEMGYQVAIETVNGREMLRFTAPMFEDNTGYVLFELCQMNYDENFELFQIFSTMIMSVGPGMDKLRAALNDWNLTALLGAYGIYEELGQLYHKYNVVIGLDDTPDSIVGQLLSALYIAMDEIERRLADAIALSSGK